MPDELAILGDAGQEGRGSMGVLGICLVVIGLIAIVVVSAVCLAARSARKSREMLQQAIETNQPDVAMGLIRQKWSQTSLAGLTLAGVGLALLAALVWQPQGLGGLLLFAGILLCAGTPMALFGYLQARADGRPGAVVWVAPAIASIVTAGAVFGVASRVHFGSIPTAREAREFHQELKDRVDRMREGSQDAEQTPDLPAPTGKPVSVDGHRAYPCLTGNAYAKQGCGSPYHDGIRFETTKPGYLSVFYIPDTEQYLIVGRARVTPAGVIVEDDLISVQEALGQDGGRAN